MSAEHPDHVIRTDQTIVAWNDVPVAIQKKILAGTMTEEDWNSNWDRLHNKETYKKAIQDIVSGALNELPVAKLDPRHVHVFRKEYEKCLIKGCNAKKDHHIY